MSEFAGKVAIITGGGSGIGRAAALLFAGEGAQVVVLDWNEAAGAETVDLITQIHGEGYSVPIDISKSTEVERAIDLTVERSGRIEILFANAAVEITKPIAGTSEDDWDRLYAVNMKETFLCCKHVIPVMRKQRSGSIVIASSGHAFVTYPNVILDQVFIYGPGYDRLFQQLNDLVGPEPLLPKKAYGFFQTEENGCKGSQTQLLNLARKLRDHDIPVDTLILDYEWGDGCPGEEPKYWGGLDWAPAYSTPLSPRDMLAQLHAMHFKVMLIHHNAPDFPHRAEDTPNRRGNWTSKVYAEDIWWAKIREELSIGVGPLG